MNAINGKFGLEASTKINTAFRIEPHDRVTIEGTAYRYIGHSGDLISLQRADGQGLIDQYRLGTLARLSATGRIKHEVEYYLPDDLKTVTAFRDDDFQVSDLSPEEKQRFHICHAQMQALDEMVTEGIIRPATAEIEMFRKELEERAIPYLAKVATEHDMLAREVGREQGGIAKVPKKRGGRRTESIEFYSSDYLRKLYASYKKHGPKTLVDKLCKSGNRTRSFTPEEQALLMDIIQGSYLTTERKSIKATVVDVQRGFDKENKRRAAEELVPPRAQLRVPGRDAVRGVIKRLGRFRVMVARYGHQHAMKKLRPVGKGLDISRPGERVEIDEWKIDLISYLNAPRLREALGEDFIEAIGLDKEKARWWLAAAIDCRTRIILGAKLTRNPTSSAARECLRMVVSDKGQFSDAVGAPIPWTQAVVPETLVADNGSAFKSEIFSNCCLDLQIAILRTIAGIPGMRGTIERVFETAGLDLMPRLKGRTFSNPQERGDYKASDRACLDAEDVAFVLIRWIVDIYHNTPHEGLGGRTPLEQWEADMQDGNYPLRALPDTHSKRLAFGDETRRKVSREGVRIMGIQYHNPQLAMHFLERETQMVDIRWDTDDLGAVDAFIGGKWIELHAVHDRLNGVNLHVWLKARKALRARSASRKKWNQETVFKAIDDIEALVKDRSILFGVVDTTYSKERLEKLERDLFSSFMINETRALQSDAHQPGREIPPREPDPDTPADARKAHRKAKIGKVAVRAVQPRNEMPVRAPQTDVPEARTLIAKAKAQKVWRPIKPQENNQ